MGAYCLHLGELEKSRRYSQLVLESESSPIFKCTAYLSLGNSYLLESYEKASDVLFKGLALAQQEKHVQLITICKDTINFLNNFWGKEPPFLDFDSDRFNDRSEVAFYYIRRHNFAESKKILDSIAPEDLPNIDKAYYYYYKGLITRDVNDFSKSVYFCKRAGDLS
ncbi:hypothetical protein CathTA2_0109 [Caldalkalibacillus thermarum TA2.A1]|uniref:AimR family lysis-lysogeny pheromone receptor n=1 Tax=Caldalkalibacillus thermarum (strain TA2.A1) TaxID=986075 RepID=F5LBC0_CALTT|nr:AimR family lysis-lysogeny pheromone receptor [Caldalkalibacillus thermarum]EGL81360.1 hypothetical protein CathTA2_0109 [Caldalkalibacillus thermarum TA2.A1]QZT34605.1 AimR family lysis-lysogeny pheromone receptor [Caldalkalibacillus thermarum TA2.A1]